MTKCAKCNLEVENPETCETCGDELHRECSRKYKGKRYCKKHYKEVSSQERELMGMATA